MIPIASVDSLNRPPDPLLPFSSHFPPLIASSPSSSRPISSHTVHQQKISDLEKNVVNSSKKSSSALPPSLTATQLLAFFHSLPPKSKSEIPNFSNPTVATVPTKPLPINNSFLPFTSPAASSAEGILGVNPKLTTSKEPGPSNLYSSNPGPSSWAAKTKRSTDKSLKKQTTATISPAGIPQIVIPDEVFQRGAETHKEFVVGRFFGKLPAYKTIQSVLNFMWGKGTRLEIHLIQSSRSMIVRIPNDYIRDKVLTKRIWYVDTCMFHVAQWAEGEVADTSSLECIPIWAHLKGVPFDLMTNEGLSWITSALGNPKEMDDWTKSLTNLSVAHVKVEANATKPFPHLLELVRQSGAVFQVEVEYPWLPPTCSHCKELGHLIKDCIRVTRKWVPVNKIVVNSALGDVSTPVAGSVQVEKNDQSSAGQPPIPNLVTQAHCHGI